MTVIVTNAMNIPAERAEEVTAKFAKNSKDLVGRDGFEGFELCRPSDPADNRWLVITRWRDEAAYQAWRDSKHFTHSHPGSGASPQKMPKNAVITHYQVAFSTD